MSFTRYESLADRVVVITGGASGIGEALVRAFAANPARVALLDLQEEAGAALAQALRETARYEPLFIACDLTDVDALRTALERVRRQLGPASVLVNNAANDQRQTLADVTPDQFDWMMAVNLRHVYFASQAVVPQMIELGQGSTRSGPLSRGQAAKRGQPRQPRAACNSLLGQRVRSYLDMHGARL